MPWNKETKYYLFVLCLKSIKERMKEKRENQGKKEIKTKTGFS